MIDCNDDTYNEGWDAYVDCVLYENNPYSTHKSYRYYERWIEGWIDAKKEAIRVAKIQNNG